MKAKPPLNDSPTRVEYSERVMAIQKIIKDDKDEAVTYCEKAYPQTTEEFKKIVNEQYVVFCQKQRSYGPDNISVGTACKTEADIKTIEDLNQAGKKIAVKTGSTGFIYASKNLTKAKSIVLADESACVTEVAQGKADGFIYDQLTIYRNWMKNQDTTAAVFIPFQNPEKWGAAFNKDNTALRDQFNTFLAQFQKNGGFDELSQKYLADEKAHFDELGFVWFFDVK